MSCKFLIKDSSQSDAYACSSKHNPDGIGSPPGEEALDKYCLTDSAWKDCWVYTRSEDTKMY